LSEGWPSPNFSFPSPSRTQRQVLFGDLPLRASLCFTLLLYLALRSGHLILLSVCFSMHPFARGYSARGRTAHFLEFSLGLRLLPGNTSLTPPFLCVGSASFYFSFLVWTAVPPLPRWWLAFVSGCRNAGPLPSFPQFCVSLFFSPSGFRDFVCAEIPIGVTVRRLFSGCFSLLQR